MQHCIFGLRWRGLGTRIKSLFFPSWVEDWMWCVTTSYLLVCKWDLPMRCFPVQQNLLTTTDCVGHFTVPEEPKEVSTGNGWRQCERWSPSAEHTAVRALSLPASLSLSASYINECNSCSNNISCASVQEGCWSGAEQDQLWHFGCCRWARKSQGSGIHPLGHQAHASHGTSPYVGALCFSSGPISSPKGFCSVGYLGPGRSQMEGGKSCCLTVLPACSIPESFPCLFAFDIYLFTTEVPAQSRLIVPNSFGGLVAAASPVRVLQCWECFTHRWGGEDQVPVRAMPPLLPSEVCLALGNECSSTG